MGRTARGLAAVHVSIHALREEGDGGKYKDMIAARMFLSTPSARRATVDTTNSASTIDRSFYPRPPRGGRQKASVSLMTV